MGNSATTRIDTTAAGDAWDNGSGFTAVSSSESTNALVYTLPTIMDGVTLVGSYSPGGAGGESATAWRVGYSGIEGLSLDYAQGETETVGSEATTTTMKASYAYSSFTVSYSDNNHDKDAGTTDEDVTSWNVAYTVSDNLSVTYGSEELTFGQTSSSNVAAEFERIKVTYTAGGMTLTASSATGDNVSYSTTATEDREVWALGASFAF